MKASDFPECESALICRIPPTAFLTGKPGSKFRESLIVETLDLFFNQLNVAHVYLHGLILWHQRFHSQRSQSQAFSASNSMACIG